MSLLRENLQDQYRNSQVRFWTSGTSCVLANTAAFSDLSNLFLQELKNSDMLSVADIFKQPLENGAFP